MRMTFSPPGLYLLASLGRVSLTPGRRGLVIELAAGARPN